MAPPPADTTVAPISPRTMRYALIILTGVNLLNYLDRFIVPPLLGAIKSDLQITDTQAGLLATGFLLVYMVVAPLFGMLSDRGGSRARLMAIGVVIWSVATALGGLAGSFLGLLLARAVVGVGEASYGTIAPTVLADYFPPERRGRVLSIFYIAVPVGGALGYIVGGLMNSHFGWRPAFWIAGIPGLLLAWFVLRLPTPPSSPDRNADRPARRGIDWEAYRHLMRNGRFGVTVLGYAAYTFGIGALAHWMPEFLKRVRGLPSAEADTNFGLILVVTGLVGTILGGWLGDRLLRYTRHAYLLVSGVATLLAAPLTWLALTATDKVTYLAALTLGEILIFVCTGPINSAILNYVAPRYRASAMGLTILLIHLFGDVPSPALVGRISDGAGLQAGMMIIPVAVLISGMIWTLGAWPGRRATPHPT